MFKAEKIHKLLQKIAGTDVSEKYVDKEQIKKVAKEQVQRTEEPKKADEFRRPVE